MSEFVLTMVQSVRVEPAYEAWRKPLKIGNLLMKICLQSAKLSPPEQLN